MKHSEAVDRENQKALMRKGLSEKDAVIHSMKNKKAGKEKDASMKVSPTSHEQYPYGLRIHVDGEQAKKLGVHKAKAGHKVHIKAKAHVISVSHDHRHGEKPSSRMELQITHMGVKHAGGPDNPEEEAGEPMNHDEAAEMED